MATLRRNWPFFTILVVLCFLCVPVLIPHFFQKATVAQETATAAKDTYTPLESVDQDALRNLRAELGLDDDALIAMNLNADQAEQVLAAIRTWYEQNKTTLHTYDLAVAEKEYALRKINKQIRTGPALPNARATRTQAIQALAAAQNSRQNYLQSALAAAGSKLSDAQKALLTTLKANRDEPIPYRLIAMTPAQKQALQTARRHYERNLLAAEDEQARQAVESAWTTKLASILDPNQREKIAAFLQQATQASERVLTAQQKVLPTAGSTPLPSQG